MILTVAVGLGASVGTMCRYLLDQVIQHQHN